MIVFVLFIYLTLDCNLPDIYISHSVFLLLLLLLLSLCHPFFYLQGWPKATGAWTLARSRAATARMRAGFHKSRTEETSTCEIMVLITCNLNRIHERNQGAAKAELSLESTGSTFLYKWCAAPSGHFLSFLVQLLSIPHLLPHH